MNQKETKRSDGLSLFPSTVKELRRRKLWKSAEEGRIITWDEYLLEVTK